MMEAIYTEADANRDSKITLEEWSAANPDSNKDNFYGSDSNNDKVISPQEAKAFFDESKVLDEIFANIDSDGDGKATKAEVNAFMDKLDTMEGTKMQKISNTVE